MVLDAALLVPARGLAGFKRAVRRHATGLAATGVPPDADRPLAALQLRGGRPVTTPTRAACPRVLETSDDSLLDLVDNLLNRGVMISGEVMLGLAGVDLVYLRLQALLCAADRVPRREEP